MASLNIRYQEERLVKEDEPADASKLVSGCMYARVIGDDGNSLVMVMDCF
jgi:hypothetical protein